MCSVAIFEESTLLDNRNESAKPCTAWLFFRPPGSVSPIDPTKRGLKDIICTCRKWIYNGFTHRPDEKGTER